MLRIHAGSVHLVTAPPIQDGAVLVDDHGRIAALGPDARVPAPTGIERLEFPQASVVPGLVNCHTHLELTHLAGKNAEREFVQWIPAIRTLKDATPPDEFSRAAEQGVRDCWAAGARGIPVTQRGRSPVEYLVQLGVVHRGTACLCIHCVQVDQRDVALLRDAGAAIAHCPRSNRAHGHGTAPLGAFRRAGLKVGFGTDSVVSAGDVDLWSEATAAGLGGEEALRMLTLEGAQALGLESEIGSLEVGKEADLAVISSTALYRPLPPSAALLTVVARRG